MVRGIRGAEASTSPPAVLLCSFRVVRVFRGWTESFRL